MAFISLQDVPVQTIRPGDPLLRMDNVTLDTPNRQVRLVNGLNLQVGPRSSYPCPAFALLTNRSSTCDASVLRSGIPAAAKVVAGDSLLIMGPSGAGKTSILRAIAGLWNSGTGSIRRYVATNGC